MADPDGTSHLPTLPHAASYPPVAYSASYPPVAYSTRYSRMADPACYSRMADPACYPAVAHTARYSCLADPTCNSRMADPTCYSAVADPACYSRMADTSCYPAVAHPTCYSCLAHPAANPALADPTTYLYATLLKCCYFSRENQRVASSACQRVLLRSRIVTGKFVYAQRNDRAVTPQRSNVLVVNETTAEQQFDAIFSQYGDFVYTIALALLNNVQDSEDAVQEVFMRVYRSLGSYDEVQGSMEQWLHTILLNYCRDKWRKRRLFSIPISLLARNYNGKDDREGDWENVLARAGNAISHEPTPDVAALRHEMQSELWAAINQLDERLRRVVVLRYYIGLSGTEVADTLGLPEGTIYSRLHHARSELQKLLKSR
jgi:RNA polymerase sigma-70 factor (ECF subfamily)